VIAFRTGRKLIVPLLYGEQSDWLRNLESRGGHVVRGGVTYPVRPPRVVDSDAAGELLELTAGPRRYCRMADKQVIFELGRSQPGFGPSRDASRLRGAA
jgi:hypothetical protein